MASEESTSTQVRPPAHRAAPTALHLELTPTLHQLVESPQPPMPPSKLIKLPTELLDLIFKDVYATRPPYTPICRALLPYHDKLHRPRFRRVKVVGSVMLASYCGSLKIRSSIGALCESFKVVHTQAKSLAIPVDPPLIDLLLSSLPSVGYLELSSHHLVDTFLERAATSGPSFMPHLAHLVLSADSGGQHPDPYDPSLLLGLGALTRLKKLYLHLVVDEGELVEVQQDVQYSCAALRELTLVDCKSSPGAVDFIQRCTQLETLNLLDDLKALVEAPFLDGLGQLGTVTTLKLSSTVTGHSWKLPKALKNLSSLDNLILGEGCACRDKPSFEILRHIPIKHVAFKLGSVVSAPHLLELVGGDNKHEHLNLLVLNQVWADLGEVQDLSWREQRRELDDWLSGGWTLPKWNKTFSREGLEAIIAAGARSGVVVSGEAVDALDLEWEIKDKKEEVKGWQKREARRERRGWSDGWGGGGGRRGGWDRW
ncbi:hypothetical protein JCM9279_000583 [Rhodotorula babjevae]